MGFLAGIIAGDVARALNDPKVGVVGGKQNNDWEYFIQNFQTFQNVCVLFHAFTLIFYCIIMFIGPPIPPVKKFVNGFLVGARDACPECTIYETYSDSFVSFEEGQLHGDEMIEKGVRVAACGGGFTGSMVRDHSFNLI